MARQICDAEQTVTHKPIPNLAVLCLVIVALMALTGGLPATQAQSLQHQKLEFQQTRLGQIPGHRIESGEEPNGLSTGDWASIQGQITAGKYRAHQHTNGSFVSSNPAQGWRIHYAGDGTTTLTPRDRQAQAYHLGLKLSAVGYTELQTLVRPTMITADDITVTYQWNDTLREWWVNSSTNLEQWFELEQRPPGTQNGQPLILVMTLATDLVSSQKGNALRFISDVGTTISYNKLKAWDASGRALPARMQLDVNVLSLIIDDSDASYPVTIDPSFEQQTYLKASNSDGMDEFGFSVAISGDTLVVSARYEDSNAIGVNGDQSNNSVSSAGAAYVFVRTGAVWSQQAYLKASNTGNNDQFGSSVAISGDTLVIGAHFENSGSAGINGDQGDNSKRDSGAAYVFTRNGTIWTQQAYLKASNPDIEDYFGWSVTISGNTLVVGARFESSNATGVNGNQGDNSVRRAGAAYVFIRSGTIWSQQAYLKSSSNDVLDQFGFSVGLSGETLIVGVRSDDSNATGINGDPSNNSSAASGAAYIFIRSGSVWSEQAYLKASNTGVGDRFGFSVAISGDTAVVGALWEGSDSTGVNGNQDNNFAESAGAVYVFIRRSSVWSQQAYLKASNTGANDQFGYSVAISGDTLVVGANQEGSDADGNNGDQSNDLAFTAGAGYIFTRSSAEWSQRAYLKSSNSDSGDFFGISVAVSNDLLAVGALGEDSNAQGINGDSSDNSREDSGAAYVFSSFTINSGLNDAWFNADTDGQGFFITVFPDLEVVVLAWFTYDTELPPDEAPSNLGDAGHRWLLAVGAFVDNVAMLDIEIASGGLFDTSTEIERVTDGSIILSFEDCSKGTVEYDIPSINRQGIVPIQRVANDNIALCLALRTD